MGEQQATLAPAGLEQYRKSTRWEPFRAERERGVLGKARCAVIEP